MISKYFNITLFIVLLGLCGITFALWSHPLHHKLSDEWDKGEHNDGLRMRNPGTQLAILLVLALSSLLYMCVMSYVLKTTKYVVDKPTDTRTHLFLRPMVILWFLWPATSLWAYLYYYSDPYHLDNYNEHLDANHTAKDTRDGDHGQGSRIVAFVVALTNLLIVSTGLFWIVSIPSSNKNQEVLPVHRNRVRGAFAFVWGVVWVMQLLLTIGTGQDAFDDDFDNPPPTWQHTR